MEFSCLEWWFSFVQCLHCGWIVILLWSFCWVAYDYFVQMKTENAATAHQQMWKFTLPFSHSKWMHRWMLSNRMVVERNFNYISICCHWHRRCCVCIQLVFICTKYLVLASEISEQSIKGIDCSLGSLLTTIRQKSISLLQIFDQMKTT